MLAHPLLSLTVEHLKVLISRAPKGPLLSLSVEPPKGSLSVEPAYASLTVEHLKVRVYLLPHPISKP
jgi:hypothetical protein